MAARTRWGFFSIEFGWFGFGSVPHPIFPHAVATGPVRISWGKGDIPQAIADTLKEKEK